MFFHRKTVKPSVSRGWVLLPARREKSAFRIVEMIRKSDFCSRNPIIKRLIVKNIEVCCIVFETSGSQSLKVILASVPLVVNLLSRTHPKFRAFLEDVAPLLDFLQEVEFESVLSSLCSATVVIQNGIQKCYSVVCLQLGPEVASFGKSFSRYILQLSLEGMLHAARFIYEDLPCVLQTLCVQNYTVAKYCAQNLPLMALVFAKQSVLFALFIRRVTTAGLQSVKEWLCPSQDLHSLFVVSALNYFLLQFLNGCLPVLKKSVPLILIESTNFVKKVTPILKKLINHVKSWLPKLYSAVGRNRDSFVCLYRCLVKSSKLLLQFSLVSCEIFLAATKNLSELIHPIIKDMYSTCKSFLRLLKHVCMKIKEQIPPFYRLVQRTLISNYMLYFKILKKSVSYLILLVQKVMCQESFLRPLVREADSFLRNCSKEVATQTARCFRRVTPSVWRGLKTVTPVMLDASCEFALTIKTSVSTVYPELLQAALVASPEVQRALLVVLRDSGKAYMEIAHSACLASKEALLVAKCVFRELPLVLRAVSEVTLAATGAISEVVSTSSRAGTRARRDVHSALRTMRSALDSAELELSTTASEIAFSLESVVSDHKEVLEVTILLKKTSGVVVRVTSKQCYSSLKTISALSLCAVRNSVDTIQDVAGYINCIKLQSQRIIEALFQVLGFECSANQCMKNLSDGLCVLCSDFITSSISCTSGALIRAVLHHLAAPNLWQLSKRANAALWSYFCQSAFSLWTLLEKTSTASWLITCAHVPGLWNHCKLFSSRTWDLSRDLSPILWKAALPIFPVLWSAHCDVVQCVWEIHLGTCSRTWRFVVPLSSASWGHAVKTLPKLWSNVRENSRTGWGSLCDTVEFGWSATTRSSSFSWHVLHKMLSKSWKHALRPVTTSTCYSFSSVVVKSIQISYNVCAETKKLACIL